MGTKFNSKEYWQNRYVGGGNSGAGSYGRLAKYKATFLNEFVSENSIQSVIEFGSGDGNQLTLAEYPAYLGLDVSVESIEQCLRLFSTDVSKSFMLYEPTTYHDPQGFVGADLSLSLDVIFHLVEDGVFEKYIHDLFNSARRFVIIYASNRNDYNPNIPHLKHRKFTSYIDKKISGWSLKTSVENDYPFDPNDPDETSYSDFYIYEKR
jgi:hypothetical protein